MDEKLIESMLHGTCIRAYLNTIEDDREYLLVHTPENIAKFIALHQFESSTMTFSTMDDQFIMDTVHGRIHESADDELLNKVLRILIPLQGIEYEGDDVIARREEEVLKYMSSQTLSM